MSPTGTSARCVLMVTYPGIQLLDVAGPLGVLCVATDVAAARGLDPGYAPEVIGPEPGLVRADSGLGLAVDRAYENLPAAIDTLVVAGAEEAGQTGSGPRVLSCVGAAAVGARRVTSVCTGAFVLAAAGLLDGRRATTHWRRAEELARGFPRVAVDPDALYVRDGPVWTSAGGTAGMDLALALVEEDLGHEVALEVSRRMLLFPRRSGGQSQFSTRSPGLLAERDRLRTLQAWIVEHPELPHRVEALADRAGMSPRNFSRVFAAQVGVPPARFVERVRVEAARQRLEESSDTLEEVAGAVGFASPETLRRAFLRQLGVGPSAYRERFTNRSALGPAASPVSALDAPEV